jgi:regulator of protease activity HflC (stomatin/prohibitin superfamily)
MKERRRSMFGIGYFKGQPTEYVIQFAGGQIRRKGRGLAFFYLAHDTQIVAVPESSTDAHFVFNEMTGNFQAVTVQGQCTYRISDPEKAAELLNFAIEPRTRTHISNDPDLLPQRIINIIQMETRSEIQKRSLEETLRQSERIAQAVLKRVAEEALLEPLGVELLSIYFVSARPTPEVSKALEAEYRETLLRKADEAIYRRRAAAVEEERTIKEKELNTAIALEEKRQALIELEGGNAQAEAENRGKALEKESEYKAKAMERELAVYGSLDPNTILSLGFKQIGENAGKIGNFTITSEILAALLDGRRMKQ